MQIRQRIDGQNAGPAAICNNRKAVASNAFHARDHFRRFEHLMQVENAQDARAAKGGGEDVIGAGQRPGVRKGGLRALGMAAGLDRDHRLRAGAAPCRGHEFRRVRDPFNIKEDRAAHDLARQIVQHVAEIHVGGIADRDHMAKSHAFHGGPIEHCGHQGARLRDERDIAALGEGLREAGVEVQVWHLDAQAVRADDAQEIGPRGFPHLLSQLSGNAGRYDHGGAAALAAKLRDDARDRMRRGGHHAELRHEGQALAGSEARLA